MPIAAQGRSAGWRGMRARTASAASGPVGRAALLATLLAACASGPPPNLHADEPIGSVQQVYDGALLPDLQVATFRNIDRLYPVRVVHRGGDVRPLPLRDRPLPALHFESHGARFDLLDYVSYQRVSGLLVLQDGAIAYETYQLGNDERTRWMSMSMVKSVLAMLVGAAIQEGRIASVDDPVTRYLPELAGSAYDGASVRDLLTMSSGVAWNETYTDPTSDRRRMLEAQNSQRPGAVLELMASLPRAAPPGTRFNYSTGETHVVGALLRAAVGRPLADYLSERIWSRLGMESDATWWLEAPDGLEVGGSGLSATLRDYGRFGLFMLDGGRIDGEPILPDGWVEEAARPHEIGGELVDYGYLTWPVSAAKHPIHAGAFEAVGIFGQHLYVNPAEKVVIVVWGATSKPLAVVDPVEHDDFFAAVCAELRQQNDPRPGP